MANHNRPQDLYAELKARFPWLETDEPVSGADVVEALGLWYADLQQKLGYR